MSRFTITDAPIVRIKNRMFVYIEEMDTITGTYPGLSDLDFEHFEEYYDHYIDRQEIDSAYFVDQTYVEYKGS